MQKLNSVNSNAELQQRLADHGGSGDTARENGTKHILSPAEPVDTVHCSSRKMLVGLDILCLLVGKRKKCWVTLCNNFPCDVNDIRHVIRLFTSYHEV